MICINRYFMGDIKLASVDGFGTDTYIYLQVSSYILFAFLLKTFFTHLHINVKNERPPIIIIHFQMF